MDAMNTYKIFDVLLPSDQEYLKRAIDFANLFFQNENSCLYDIRRNKTAKNYIDVNIEQKKFSTYFEFLARDFFINQYDFVTLYKDVDTALYKVKNKGWTADFALQYTIKNKNTPTIINMHCKLAMRPYRGNLYSYGITPQKITNGCDLPYQYSYIFQVEDAIFNDNYISKANTVDMACLGHKNKDDTCQLDAIIRVDLAQKLFVNPFSKNLWPTVKPNGKITGKKAIMSTTCGNHNGLPCGIHELPERLCHEKNKNNF